MSPVNVLDFVARELKGRIMTVSSLSAFVAAEKAADRLAMTTISREAAQLAVLLPSAPIERISREFGSETPHAASLRAAQGATRSRAGPPYWRPGQPPPCHSGGSSVDASVDASISLNVSGHVVRCGHLSGLMMRLV